jgi:DNA invertase Pin-like site-specific DNA recombinase
MSQPPDDPRIDVAYMRCSTIDQGKKYGLDRQREALERDALRDNEPIQEWLTDLESGTTENRKQFQRLQRMVAQGLVRSVRVLCVDRFARNAEDALRVARQFGQKNTALKFVEMPMDLQTPMGMLQFTQIAAYSAWESAIIRDRSINGRAIKMAGGKPDCWVLPYGYRVVKDTPEIDPAEAQVVRDIFQWRRSGKSVYEILALLALKGYKPRRAKRWWQTSVVKILKSRCYIGEYRRCGKMYPIPPIIELGLFEEVSDRMELVHRETVGRKTHAYELSQKVYCQCGRCRVGTSSSREWHYYRCVTAIKRFPDVATSRCGNPFVRADHLHEGVWRATWELLIDPARLRKLAEADQRESAKGNPGERDPLIELEAERAKEARIKEGFKAGILTKEEAARDITLVRAAIARLVIEVQALRRIVEIAPLNAVERACREIQGDVEPRGMARRIIYDKLIDFRVKLIGDQMAEVSGRIPIPAAEDGKRANSTHQLGGMYNLYESIPFSLKVKIAA